jgi:hypothetical protein
LLNGELRADEVVSRLPVRVVPIDTLHGGESPRSSGQDTRHVATLAQIDAPLPPILVHTRTLRVIDGLHRIEAARLRGDREIEARLFDGDDESAFLLAVEMNTSHGLPLTLGDRSAAAERILNSYPHLSDRAIAGITGLAASTVGAVRHRSATTRTGADARLGWDGRIRPLDGSDGRRLAVALISQRPTASLREIARDAGISPATVRDVRMRLSRGDDPVPPRRQETRRVDTDGPVPPRQEAPGQADAAKNPTSLLQQLRRDPSLRFNDAGRTLLMWLGAHTAGLERWPELAPQIPPHCTFLLADLARECASVWTTIAEELAACSAEKARTLGRPG